MKILAIEDEDRSIRQLRAVLLAAAPDCELTVATSRDDAVQILPGSEWDLVICDLKIPPHGKSADRDEVHGLTVHKEARTRFPGVPQIFLTAFADQRNLRNELSGGGTASFLGLKDWPMVRLIEKNELQVLSAAIEALHQAHSTLSSTFAIEGPCPSPQFARAVQIYGKEIGCTRASVEHAVGLSGAAVGRVEYESAHGLGAAVFLKVLDQAKALREYSRFTAHVPGYLQPGYFAPSIPPLLHALGSHAALVSTLAESGYVSIFESLEIDPDQAASTLADLRIALNRWRNSTETNELTLAEMTRDIVSDEVLLLLARASGQVR